MSDDQKKPTGALHLTDDSFQEELIKAGDQPVFIDFYADWCGPCQMAAPIVEKLAQEYAGKVVIAKLNVDENPNTAQMFGVMSIPTVIIMKKKDKQMEEFDRKIGFPGEQGYKQMLTAALEK